MNTTQAQTNAFEMLERLIAAGFTGRIGRFEGGPTAAFCPIIAEDGKHYGITVQETGLPEADSDQLTIE